MAITVSGISSGIDVDSLVTQLMEVEQAPLTKLTTKQSKAQTKISALGSLKSVLASLQTAAKALVPATGKTATDKFSAYSASIADTSIASITTNSSAVAGTYSLEVTQLAQAHQIASSASAFTTVGTTTTLPTGGTLTISLGTAADADATKTTSIAIADGATPEQIRDAINKASAGVSATVINGSDGKQLVLTGTTSGDDQVITLSGIDGLSYDGSGSGSDVDEFSQMQAAQGSAFKLNGIAVTASTNTVSTAIDGLTLSLAKQSAKDVATSITVTRSTSSLTTAVNAFVTAFNGFSTTASSLGSYNATTETAGTLNGDSTLRSAQNKMRSLLSNIPSEASGSTYKLLSNIGVSMQKDGTLAVDATKLSKAISDDFAGVANLVSAVGSAYSGAIEGLIGTEGTIAARTSGLNTTIKSYEKQYDVISARLEKIEARYRAQFTALDTLIAGLNSTSTYLTQQLANLPSYNSSN